MKRLTVVSGKGGVGKSSVAASLVVIFSERKNIIAADLDVDASNLGIILGVDEYEDEKEISTNFKAFLDESKCNSCGKCRDTCTFSAIKWNEERDIPIINKYLCEGCGACKLICPQDAIRLEKVNNAVVGRATTDYGFDLMTGQLKMGESGSGKVVDKIKKGTEEEDADLMVADSAAGIGCPVIASVRGSDFVLCVTEPSPSALSDLKRVLRIIDHFGLESGLVINKWDLNREFSREIEKFAEGRDMEVLGNIPYDRVFVESLVERRPVVEKSDKYRRFFEELADRLEEII